MWSPHGHSQMAQFVPSKNGVQIKQELFTENLDIETKSSKLDSSEHIEKE